MILGIDFGYYSVKVAVLDNVKSGKKIIAIGEQSIIDGFKNFNPDKVEVSHWIAAFQDLSKKLKINIKKITKIVSSISGTQVTIKPITTLEMEASELVNTLLFEAKKHVPLDGSDPVIDYHILGQNNKEIDKINIILAATTQKIIKNHDLIMKGCNIKNAIFDTDPIALFNCYQYNYELPNNDVDVILHMGNLTSTIVVCSSKQELFTREIAIGGHHINLSVMNLKNINYKESEEQKIKNGTNLFDVKNDDSEIIQLSEKNIFLELSDEIRKTLRYYMKSKTGVSYNKFYISGGLSNMPGIIEFLNKSLNIEISKLNPFKKVENSINILNPTSYSVSVGLALRGSLDNKNNFNSKEGNESFLDKIFIKPFNQLKKMAKNYGK